MPEKEIRKLAAVMFTDIAGYTAMVQEDEAAALKKVSRYRQVLQDCTDKYGGQVIAFYGDGSLSIYPSASDAVRCGIEMQEQYRSGHPVPVRIGLHLGDIVLKDETVYGDGVNVASRIESQGVPGAILISGKMQREVLNQADIKTVHLGAYDLKNVKERIDIYAVTNEGLIIPAKPTSAPRTRRRIQRISAVAVLLFLAGYFLADAGLLPFLKSKEASVPLLEQRVAVLFRDFIKNESLDLVPEMASRLLVDALLEVPNTKVISYESAQREVQDLNKTGGKDILLASTDYARFAAMTGAVNYLDGMVMETDQGDSLQFRAKLIDLSNPDEVIKLFDPVKCSVNDPEDGISRLRNAVLGFWASREDKVLTIPTMESYKAYLNARKVWQIDNGLALQRLERSIALDSSFMDPYFLVVDHHINTCNWPDAQRYLDLIRIHFDNLTKRHRNLLNYYQADINGESIKAYNLFQEELAIDPRDHFVNTTAMHLAAEYVHSADKVIEYFEMIPIDSLDISECVYCLDRYNLVIDAHLQKGNTKKAWEIAQGVPVTSVVELRSNINVYVRMNDTSALNQLIRETLGGPVNDDWYPFYYAGRRFELAGQSELAKYYANLSLDVLQKMGNKWNETRIKYSEMKTHYLLRDYQAALKLITSEFNGFAEPHAFAGLIHAKTGNRAEALIEVQKLDQTQPCREGDKYYYKAVIYAQLGDVEEAIKQLAASRAAGTLFTFKVFENDPDLMPLKDDPRFQQIVYPVID